VSLSKEMKLIVVKDDRPAGTHGVLSVHMNKSTTGGIVLHILEGRNAWDDKAVNLVQPGTIRQLANWLLEAAAELEGK
jgi:hypothetical protein